MSTDLEAAISGETTAPEPEVTPAAEPEPQAVEAQAEPEATPEPEQPKEESPMVPLAALTEVRRELQSVKAMLPQPEQPKAPDVFEDQQGFTSHLQAQVHGAVQQTSLRQSRFFAEREFGKDVVEQAYAYFDQHPEKSGALLEHPSPFHAAVEEYQKHQIAQEIGNDPQAYAAKIAAEVRKQVEAEVVAKQAADTAQQSAPSMANVTGTGGGPRNTWAGPTPLSALFKDG